MANVKHTTNNGEILTTSCKRLSTALRRFTAFLKEYDRYYNEMLSELNSENANVTRDTCDTETVTMTLTNDTGTYTLTIKHDAKTPETIWCICTQDGVIKDFTDRKELFKYAYEHNLCDEFDKIWIEEKELKDSTHKYYETVDYESLDLYHVRSMLEFDICDMEINDTDTTEATAEQTEAEQPEAEAEQSTNIKFYTNIEKLSDNYFSLEYYEVRNNKIGGHGFEDFTRERIKTAVKFYDVKLLTGDSVTTTTGTTRRKKETLSHVVAVPASVKKSDVLALVVLEYGENVEISKTYPHYCWYESFNYSVKKFKAYTFNSEQPEAEQTEAEQTESATAEQTAEQTKSATADYNCFSDVKMTGTKAQIKYATDILNEYYKLLCNDIDIESKM